ncbi:ROK family transcriptional regulator [Amycolatopsis sp. PS_44_ISF1]|uniref:ROK family transcriptional regulator n=1 Tax=Amycolatopsis sp. PS_44_ISF1 TaxID=2974917 RepID=UPI0028DF8774|nr:ROK family transcriptional regulator [Amycolatopsis sp. PS_44_ISF1]MDT8914520.1 ROK family transcriptional regulator [Amycolatopsis sp. PS_44_ISF1]
MTQAVRHDSMRARNLELVLGEVGRRGPLTRAALAELTGLTKSTVSKLVGDLVDAGLLAETGPARAGERGRPGVEVVLSGARVASLGLEVNVDYLAVCLLDLAGVVRRTRRRERDNRGSRPSTVVRELAGLATGVLDEASALGLTVAGAVLAVSGPVGDGVVLSAPNLGWQGVRAAAMLRLPVPVDLDNEANLGALGELWFGAGGDDFLYVSGEVGIGAGLVVGGSLFRGAHGLAGELGHVVVSPSGPACRCGSAGCLEVYAGQEALLRAAGVPSVPDLVAALESGTAAAVGAGAAAGEALGHALASAVNLLDLDRIVLGGAFARLFPWLAPAADSVLTARLGRLRGSVPTLVPSTLPGDAATLGAAGRTIHRVLADPSPFLART